MHFADFVGFAGVIQNAFRRGSLSSINVSDNTEVSNFLQRVISVHKLIDNKNAAVSLNKYARL